MKRNMRLQSLLPLLWLLVIPVLNMFYMVLNHGGVRVHNLMTDLDHTIPFLPVFIVPYVLWYPFLIGVFILLCLKNQSIYYQTLLAVILGLLTSYLTYYVFQTTVPRPELQGNGILIQLVKGIYTLDGPYNCFPSIHVMTSYLLWMGARSCHAIPTAIKWMIGAMSWLIILSTFFVKQHAILDAVGAIILAEIVFRCAPLLLRHIFGYRISGSSRSRYAPERQKPMS